MNGSTLPALIIAVVMTADAPASVSVPFRTIARGPDSNIKKAYDLVARNDNRGARNGHSPLDL